MLGKREYLREFGSHAQSPGSNRVLLRAIYAAVNRTSAGARSFLEHQQRASRHCNRGGRLRLEPVSPQGYVVLWIATVVSNVGTWLYNAASGWLMTGLDPDPFIVAMVQVATTLPMFLFALPAGALADIIDKRRFLIAVEVATTAVSTIYAATVALGLVTPGNLLLFTFLIGAGVR